MSGDHMVFELLPVRTRDPERIGVTGSFTLLWNPLDTLSDQHLNAHPGQEGLEWSSGARVASRITSNAWETELELPLKHLPDVAAKPYVELPPKAGDYWSAGVARRFGKAGENLFATWDNSSLTVQESGMGAQCRAWTRKPVLRFADGGLALQVLDLGNLPESQLHTDIRLYNRDPSAEHTATLDAHVQDSKGRKLWAQSQTVKVPPGQRVVCPPFKAQLKIEPRGSLLYLRATQDGEKPLFDSSALELVRFDDVTRQQFRRSIEVLRKP
jgi:hypothetical protein